MLSCLVDATNRASFEVVGSCNSGLESRALIEGHRLPHFADIRDEYRQLTHRPSVLSAASEYFSDTRSSSVNSWTQKRLRFAGHQFLHEYVTKWASPFMINLLRRVLEHRGKVA